MSFFDIPVSFGSLFQRIASIYGRFYLSRLNKPFEENQIFSPFLSRPKKQPREKEASAATENLGCVPPLRREHHRLFSGYDYTINPII
jgi:hypothetical protein